MRKHLSIIKVIKDLKKYGLSKFYVYEIAHPRCSKHNVENFPGKIYRG